MHLQRLSQGQVQYALMAGPRTSPLQRLPPQRLLLPLFHHSRLLAQGLLLLLLRWGFPLPCSRFLHPGLLLPRGCLLLVHQGRKVCRGSPCPAKQRWS